MKANMTNEEMAKNLIASKPLSSMITTADFEKVVVEMARWKDEQFKESVNKAIKRLEINLKLTEDESTHIRKLFNF